nr:hypothetical protein BaRGS_003572 [Batillaria attramentaria]
METGDGNAGGNVITIAEVGEEAEDGEVKTTYQILAGESDGLEQQIYEVALAREAVTMLVNAARPAGAMRVHTVGAILLLWLLWHKALLIADGTHVPMLVKLFLSGLI